MVNSRLIGLVYFVVAALLITLIMPRETRFKYEFRKGTAWTKEDLTAPFDFSVYKTELEIKEEANEIRRSAKPVYRIEGEAPFRTKSQLKSELQDFKQIDTKIQSKLYDVGSAFIDSIYSVGLIQINAENELKSNDLEITVIDENNMGIEMAISELYTEKLVSEKLEEKSFSPDKDVNLILVSTLKGIIKPNIIFDAKKGEAIIRDQINTISLTEGLVAKGTPIISKGETVNDRKFKLLESLKREYSDMHEKHGTGSLVLIAKFLLIILILSFLYFFLYFFRSAILDEHNKLLSVLISVVLTVSAASIVSGYENLSIYMVPFCILTILMRFFFDTRLALFAHLVTIMISGSFASNGYEFLLLQFAGGLTAIFSFVSLRKRSQMFFSAGIIFLVYSSVYVVLALLRDGTVQASDIKYFKWFAYSCGFTLLSFPVIFLYEKVFRLTGDISLLELSDTNNKLLRMLSDKAPGTFQHSLQVANLAESAAQEINGNTLLVRTGALYHDIGKMVEPQYFIENLSGNINPHDQLTFEQSAEKIIAHVREGIALARKHNLPEVLVRFIATHHGTGKVQYFYRNYLKHFPDQIAVEERFSYPGPIPATKEEAILMMADSVEAASRSLKEYSPEIISDLVEKIISYQIEDHQFINADITLKDIETIKGIFKTKLMNIYHVRIAYPER